MSRRCLDNMCIWIMFLKDIPVYREIILVQKDICHMTDTLIWQLGWFMVFNATLIYLIYIVAVSFIGGGLFNWYDIIVMTLPPR
jgi:hypothetical protein